MSSAESSKPPPRRIDLAAKVRFLEGLRAGKSRKDAAAGSGFSWQAFYQVRRRDPIFAFGWAAALELSGVDERDARRAAAKLAERQASGEIAGNNRRRVQLHKARRGFKFTEARQQRFLDFFAGTADEDGAADAAGVSRQTVRAAIRRDPEFAQLRDEALRQAYARLEAEALRQRLAAQQRLRDNMEPAGEIAEEFERVMKLLARYDRKDGTIGTRRHRPSPGRVWSFEESIRALDKALDALGTRRTPFPAEFRDEDGGDAGGQNGGDGE